MIPLLKEVQKKPYVDQRGFIIVESVKLALHIGDNMCPICGTNAIHSKHNDRDWYNISCNDPTCLTPSTGWMSRKMAYSKWLENHNKIKKKVINAQNK